jgi:hypothetical protein
MRRRGFKAKRRMTAYACEQVLCTRSVEFSQQHRNVSRFVCGWRILDEKRKKVEMKGYF